MKNKFKEMSFDELTAKREELRKKAFDYRMNVVLGHVENPLQIRILKRDIARLNTMIHKKQIDKYLMEHQGD